LNKTKKLIIVGNTGFAEVAHEYFEADSTYEVNAFSVERAFLEKKELRGLPVDSVIMSIILRSRNAGFDAYWLPQAEILPMANRREDVLIIKP